jgi:hypothetical protein
VCLLSLMFYANKYDRLKDPKWLLVMGLHYKEYAPLFRDHICAGARPHLRRDSAPSVPGLTQVRAGVFLVGLHVPDPSAVPVPLRDRLQGQPLRAGTDNAH